MAQCSQRPTTTAGAGWSTLADRYGFALLMPEQSGRENKSEPLFQLVPAQLTLSAGGRRGTLNCAKWFEANRAATTTSIVGEFS